MIVRLAILAVLVADALVVPCADGLPAKDFVGPPLPACTPSPELLEDLEFLRELELLENWEVLGD